MAIRGAVKREDSSLAPLAQVSSAAPMGLWAWDVAICRLGKHLVSEEHRLSAELDHQRQTTSLRRAHVRVSKLPRPRSCAGFRSLPSRCGYRDRRDRPLPRTPHLVTLVPSPPPVAVGADWTRYSPFVSFPELIHSFLTGPLLLRIAAGCSLHSWGEQSSNKSITGCINRHTRSKKALWRPDLSCRDFPFCRQKHGQKAVQTRFFL